MDGGATANEMMRRISNGEVIWLLPPFFPSPIILAVWIRSRYTVTLNNYINKSPNSNSR